MKFSEIKDVTQEELKKRLKAARVDLFESKMRHSLGQLSNTDHIRQVRRSIAKLKTALNLQPKPEMKETKAKETKTKKTKDKK